MYLLGYDIGSSSVKASLVNSETGKCVASAFYPKTEAEIIAVHPGWAEQKPEMWWANLKLATEAVMNESGVRKEDIAVSVFLIRCMVWYVWTKSAGAPSGYYLVRFSCGSVWREGFQYVG